MATVNRCLYKEHAGAQQLYVQRTFICSTSGFASYRKDKGAAEADSSLDDAIASIAEALGQAGKDPIISLDWPVSLVLARKAADS